MKSHTAYLTVNVPARMDFLNITGEVEATVGGSGVQEGLCLVNAMHITASVFIGGFCLNPTPGGRLRSRGRPRLSLMLMRRTRTGRVGW